MPNRALSNSAGQPRKMSVLVLDHHPVVRDSIVALLNDEPDFYVCGQAGTAVEAQQALKQSRPNFLLMELALPDRHGLEFIKDIRAEHTNLQILIFTTQDEATFAIRALRAGASGYVSKWDSVERLIDAIRLVAAGNYAVNPDIWVRFLQNPQREEAANTGSTSTLECLTDRELEVFELIGQGITTREIATQLHRSVSVVETCRLSIKEKLRLRDCADLACRAIRWVEGRDKFPNFTNPSSTCDSLVAI